MITLSSRELKKRVFDITFSFFLLFLAAIPMLIIAVIIRISTGGPILFRQTRPGRYGIPFEMVKFMTMNDSVGSDGGALPDSARITPIGRILRSSSLDELPELINVLKGDMSLVGPRPLLTRYLSLYSRDQSRRHEVRPGITGWAQINGRNSIPWEKKFAYDVWYVDNWTLVLDVRILFLTIRKVVARDGINYEPNETMPEFLGATDE